VAGHQLEKLFAEGACLPVLIGMLL
jgi:hypothetical protein